MEKKAVDEADFDLTFDIKQLSLLKGHCLFLHILLLRILFLHLLAWKNFLRADATEHERGYCNSLNVKTCLISANENLLCNNHFVQNWMFCESLHFDS